MLEKKIETLKGMCAVDVTKHIMHKLNIEADKAYSFFMQMELFQLLMETDSGLYLEQNEYLFECCDKEIELGIDGLYEFIQVA